MLFADNPEECALEIVNNILGR